MTASDGERDRGLEDADQEPGISRLPGWEADQERGFIRRPRGIKASAHQA